MHDYYTTTSIMDWYPSLWASISSFRCCVGFYDYLLHNMHFILLLAVWWWPYGNFLSLLLWHLEFPSWGSNKELSNLKQRRRSFWLQKLFKNNNTSGNICSVKAIPIPIFAHVYIHTVQSASFGTKYVNGNIHNFVKNKKQNQKKKKTP